MTGGASTQRQAAVRTSEAMKTMTVRQYLDEHCEAKVRDIENQVAKQLSDRRMACDEMKAECTRMTEELIHKLEEMIAAEEAGT